MKILKSSHNSERVFPIHTLFLFRAGFSGNWKGDKYTKEKGVNVLHFPCNRKKYRKVRQIFPGIGKGSNTLVRKESMFWIFHVIEKSPEK